MTLTNAQQEQIRACYAKKQSLRAVSKELGYSPNTIKKYVTGYYKVKEQNIVREIQSDDQRLIGTYIGLWMGDGTQYRDNGGYIVKMCLDGRNRRLLDFVQYVFKELFGCISWELTNSSNNSHYVKVHSKFIYYFVSKYCSFSNNKTHSVGLSHPVDYYSSAFLEGCLLGLMLSDGYLKKTFHFNVTSEKLANNARDILKLFGYFPRQYLQKRKNPKHKTLIHTTLLRGDSQRAKQLLDEILRNIGYPKKFETIKYGK